MNTQKHRTGKTDLAHPIPHRNGPLWPSAPQTVTVLRCARRPSGRPAAPSTNAGITTTSRTNRNALRRTALSGRREAQISKTLDTNQLLSRLYPRATRVLRRMGELRSFSAPQGEGQVTCSKIWGKASSATITPNRSSSASPIDSHWWPETRRTIMTGMGILAAGTGTGAIVLKEDTPGDGLPLAYRILYHIVGIRDVAQETDGQPVLEFRLWFSMTQPSYAPVPQGHYMEDFARRMDAEGKRLVRDAISQLERERYVVVGRPHDSEAEWTLTATASAFALMRKWQRRRLDYLEQHSQRLEERINSQPSGWRKWAQELLNPLPATALTAAVTVVVTVPTTILVTHALGA